MKPQKVKVTEQKFEDMDKPQLLLLLKLFAIEIEKLEKKNKELEDSLRFHVPDLYNICKGC